MGEIKGQIKDIDVQLSCLEKLDEQVIEFIGKVLRKDRRASVAELKNHLHLLQN